MSAMFFFVLAEKGRQDSESERTCFQVKAKRREGTVRFGPKAKKVSLGGNVELYMWKKHGEGDSHHKLTFGPFCRGFLPYGDGLENEKKGLGYVSRERRGGATTRVSKRVFERVCSVRDQAIQNRTRRRSMSLSRNSCRTVYCQIERD